MKRKYMFIAIPLLFLISIGCFFLINHTKHENSSIHIPKESVQISENLYIVPKLTSGFKTDTKDTAQTLHLINKSTGKKELIHSSDIPVRISKLKDGSDTFKKGDNIYFAAYDFTEISNGNVTSQKKEKGYVFKVDKNDKLSKVYTTTNTFESIEVVDNEIILFEKIYLDDMNMYPSHYKPYIRVKKMLSGTEFQEIERKEITPKK